MNTMEIIKSFNIGEIEKILNAISNEDAIKIFIAAKPGIKKSTESMKELGLTQRRYYVRLNELINAGLIERVEDAYQLTTLGAVCYSLGEVFNTTLSNRDRLDLADRLKKVKSISLDETKQILQAIAGKGIIGYVGVADLIQPVKMIEKYENLVNELISLIDKAEKNIYLASYYTDSRAVEALLRAFQRNVDLSLLSGSKKSISEKLQILRLILNPKMIKLYDGFVDDKIKIKKSDFPFSFCIIDEKYVVIELPNPINNDFYIGFSVQNEVFGQRLIETFKALYKEGKENSILAHLKQETPSVKRQEQENIIERPIY